MGRLTNDGKGRLGGRQKCVPNKVTYATRQVIHVFMEEKFHEFVKCWEDLTPLEKVRSYIVMIKYVMPTLASVKIENSQDKNFIDELLAKQKSMK